MGISGREFCPERHVAVSELGGVARMVRHQLRKLADTVKAVMGVQVPPPLLELP